MESRRDYTESGAWYPEATDHAVTKSLRELIVDRLSGGAARESKSYNNFSGRARRRPATAAAYDVAASLRRR